MHNGYRIQPRIRTGDLAVAVISCPSDPHDEPAQVSYTLAEAIASHRLDAWVERWRTVKAKAKNGNYYDRNIKDTFVIRVNGQPATWNGDLQVPLPDPLPDWVAEQIDLLQVKRYEAWWTYRADMMWKSAAKRAVKIACPHVLLGGGDFDHEPPGFTTMNTKPTRMTSSTWSPSTRNQLSADPRSAGPDGGGQAAPPRRQMARRRPRPSW